MEQNPPFEAIVRENQQWLLRYAAQIVGSATVAEDVVQDTFIRAYLAYDGYQERGLLRQWLRAIAHNTALRYLQKAAPYQLCGLYAAADDVMQWPADVAASVEEQVVAGELNERVMQAIAALPPMQRTTVYYRCLLNYSVGEVASLTRQPVGSVKSQSFYGLRKVRRMLLDYIAPEVEKEMECREAYVYLYQYAKKQIMSADKERVAAHLADCAQCRDIAVALENLEPHITPVLEGELRHYSIDIPLADNLVLCYFGITFPVREHASLNEALRKNNGVLPDTEKRFDVGHDVCFEHIGEFDNEGHPIEFELVPNPNNPNNVRVRYLKMTKVYPQHTMGSVGLKRNADVVSTPLEDPHLRYGRMRNNLGCNARSGLYLAIPGHAQNIRIKRGNGVIDAGPYKFAYSDRYITEDELMRLECSWLMYD